MRPTAASPASLGATPVPAQNAVEITKVYAAPAFRGSGLAQALFGEALRFRAGRRVRTQMMLWSDSRFARGHRFYEKLGFRRWPGERYLADVSETWEYHFRLDLHGSAMSVGPALRALLGIALLTVMDAVVKAQMQAHPFIVALFMRFAMGGVCALAVLAIVRPPAPTRDSLIGNSVRVPVVVLTAGSFFYSLSVLPLAEALTLAFLAPVFVALLGGLLLKEKMDAPHPAGARLRRRRACW